MPKRRFTLLSVALFFLHAVLPLDSTAAREVPSAIHKDIIQRPNIPSELAVVRLLHRGDGPPLFLIEDAHDVPEAQKTIAAVLEALASAFPRLVVGLEGAAGPLQLDHYRLPGRSRAQKIVCDLLMERGLLSGPEAFGILAYRPPLFVGLETRTLYEGHLRAYREAVHRRNEALPYIVGLQSSLDQAAVNALRSNEERELFRRACRLRNGDLSLTGFLADAAREDLDRLPEPFSPFRRVARILADNGDAGPLEHPSVVKKRVREWRRAMDEDVIAIASRSAQLPHTVAGTLRWPPEASTLPELIEEVHLVRRMVEMDLTYDDWLRFRTAPGLWEDIPGRARPWDAPSPPSDWQDIVTPFFSFYELAEERSDGMARAFTKLLRTTNRDAAALVVGGLHSRKMAEQLSREGGTIYAVTPKAKNGRHLALDRRADTPSSVKAWLDPETTALAPPRPTASGHAGSALATGLASAFLLFHQVVAASDQGPNERPKENGTSAFLDVAFLRVIQTRLVDGWMEIIAPDAMGHKHRFLARRTHWTSRPSPLPKDDEGRVPWRWQGFGLELAYTTLRRPRSTTLPPATGMDAATERLFRIPPEHRAAAILTARLAALTTRSLGLGEKDQKTAFLAALEPRAGKPHWALALNPWLQTLRLGITWMGTWATALHSPLRLDKSLLEDILIFARSSVARSESEKKPIAFPAGIGRSSHPLNQALREALEDRRLRRTFSLILDEAARNTRDPAPWKKLESEFMPRLAAIGTLRFDTPEPASGLVFEMAIRVLTRHPRRAANFFSDLDGAVHSAGHLLEVVETGLALLAGTLDDWEKDAELRKRIPELMDRFPSYVAALFLHDVGQLIAHKEHDMRSAVIAADILTDVPGFSRDKILSAARSILLHRKLFNDEREQPDDMPFVDRILTALVRDADLLALHVARLMRMNTNQAFFLQNRTTEERIRYILNEGTYRADLYGPEGDSLTRLLKLLATRKRDGAMNTPVGWEAAGTLKGPDKVMEQIALEIKSRLPDANSRQAALEAVEDFAEQWERRFPAQTGKPSWRDFGIGLLVLAGTAAVLHSVKLPPELAQTAVLPGIGIMFSRWFGRKTPDAGNVSPPLAVDDRSDTPLRQSLHRLDRAHIRRLISA